jgi:hypothetical protein
MLAPGTPGKIAMSAQRQHVPLHLMPDEPARPVVLDPVARERRLQALEAYPALHREIGRLHGAIDKGRELTPIIASIYRVKKSTVRRLSSLALAEVIHEWKFPIAKALRYVDRTPPEWIPNDVVGWKAFIRAQGGIDTLAAATGRNAVRLVAKSRGCWVQLVGNFEDSSWYLEPANALIREVLLPEIFREIDRQGLVIDGHLPGAMPALGLLRAAPIRVRRMVNDLLYGEKGPHAILKTISEWKENRGYPLNHPRAAAGDLRELLQSIGPWQPLVPPLNTPNGVVATVLGSPAEVLAEAAIMGHCAAIHIPALSYWNDVLVSIRTRDGFRLATALVRLVERKPKLMECRGPQNLAADPRAIMALNWWLSVLGRPDFASYVAAFINAQATRIEGTGGNLAHVYQSGTLYSNATVREWTFRAFFAPFLVRDHARMGRDEWLAATGLGEIMREHARQVIEQYRSAFSPAKTRAPRAPQAPGLFDFGKGRRPYVFTGDTIDILGAAFWISLFTLVAAVLAGVK